MEFIHLDFSKSKNMPTTQQLIEAIKNNNTTAKAMSEEIKKSTQIKKDNQTNSIKKEAEILPKIEEPNVIEKMDADFESEIEYYCTMLNTATQITTLRSEIESILPSKKSSNYHLITLRLKIELLKNIKDVQDLITEEWELLTLDDLREFKEEIILLENKIKIISEIENEEKSDQEEITNHFFFVPTSGGNIRILNEIKNIDSEYLEAFKGLFDSIKHGTFKNVKQLSGNNKLSQIAEVKDFKVRVVFDRIGRHDFALITAFMKKSDNDKGYKSSLELKVRNYLLQKEKMKELLHDESYRAENLLLEQELYQYLTHTEEKEYRKGI